MICEEAVYRKFRNIDDEKITFSPGVNLILGQNAQGKTNALEGIWLMASGRSHRAAQSREMIAFGEQSAEAAIKYRDLRRVSELAVTLHRSGRRVCRKNGLNVPKMSQFIGNFRAVLFTPEHLAIVKEGPAMRRGFLDAAISQLSPGYVAALQSYGKVLLQRNRLLSDIAEGITAPGGAAGQTLDIWSEKLAAEAEKISAAREDYTLRLNTLVGEIFADMTGGREQVSIVYGARRTKEQYLTALEEHRQREYRAGTTLVGVHKDDLAITINDNPVRAFGSQGQQRSVALAMKIAEGEISKEQSGEYPVFLFDDILSELDEVRKSYILAGLSGRQVLITACDILPTGEMNVIRCEAGKYRSVSAWGSAPNPG